MIVISSLGAAIVPGDFLIARRADCQSSMGVVFQVRHSINDEQVEIVWWSGRDDAPALCPVLYENLHRCRARELFEDSTTTIINPGDMIDVAFVFTADLLEQFWVDVAGMSNVFFYSCSKSHTF